jgi:hypothetical protein
MLRESLLTLAVFEVGVAAFLAYAWRIANLRQKRRSCSLLTNMRQCRMERIIY